METTTLFFTLLIICCAVARGQSCPSPVYGPSTFKALPPNSSVDVLIDSTGSGVSTTAISVTAATGNAPPKFTLGTGSNSNGDNYLNGMQSWNQYSTTDGSGASFGSGSTGNINWVVTTTWPTATVTYKDTSGHSHTVTINDSSLPTSTVASTYSLTDYNASGTPLPTAAAFVTMINTNGSYMVNGVTYPGWDPTDPSFSTALKGNGGHETGHGLGLGDRSDSGDIMSQWGWTTSNPGGATNNKGGNALYVVTSCDANEVKSNPNTYGGSGGGGSGNQGVSPPPPPPTCSISQDICTNCQPPVCTGSTNWDPQYCECYGYTSPIIVDTDGTGFHLTSAVNGVSFDFFNSGTPLEIAWTEAGSTNGWLALDRNGNGTIDSGEELFGNLTEQPLSDHQNGFSALAVFDTRAEGGNGDGIIDDRDAIWPALRVWIDSNHDGISQTNELHTLDEIGIHSIDLRYTESRRKDIYGNEFRYKGRLNPDKPNTVNRRVYDVILTNLDSIGRLIPPPRNTEWGSSGLLLRDEIPWRARTTKSQGSGNCSGTSVPAAAGTLVD